MFEHNLAGHSRLLLQKVNIKAVNALDVAAVKADLKKLLTDSKPFWPADFGTYGGLFIRLAWHCNGSFRTWDGRGGCNGARIRFEPELAWPDNTNLDKARKLLEPLKTKYGDALSWGDLIVLAGDTAIESMGGPKVPFCAGRVDDADGKASLPLGPTPEQELIAPCKQGDGMCEQPLGQTTMGLIYVNPEGVLGEPVPEKSVPHIRGTFGRMGMNDTETVALIGGGHAFGKTHGACPTGAGPDPKASPKSPWPGTCGEGDMKGKGPNAFTSGFEGSWTTTPTEWSNEYFKNLLEYDWEVHTGPGNHSQWRPRHKGDKANSTDGLPDIMMLTADVALLKDPAYLGLVEKFAANLTFLTEQFGSAWYKLMTRDMGPVTRCAGKAPPAQPWQNSLPASPKALPDFTAVRGDVLKAMATENAKAAAPDTVDGKPSYVAQLSYLAWQCANTFRATDYAGGCNGARIRFKPQKEWGANKGLDKVLAVLQPIKDKYPGLSWSDLIVLAGTAANEAAAGAEPGAFGFCGGRTDAKDGKGTDVLAPRNYINSTIRFKDEAAVRGFTLPEAVAITGQLRSPTQQKALGYSGSWSASPGKLSNAYFKALLGETWEKTKSAAGKEEYKAKGKDLYLTSNDLAILKDPQLKAIAKGYADDNAKFLDAFKGAWTKIMQADRFKGPVDSVC